MGYVYGTGVQKEYTCVYGGRGGKLMWILISSLF